MKCLREKGQGPRIDQYFLRSQSSQSNEIQRQEANHSSQDISTPVIDVRRTCMDTVSDEPNDPCEPENYILKINLADFEGEQRSALYKEFKVGDEEEYKLVALLLIQGGALFVYIEYTEDAYLEYFQN
ncbi:UNVERIFIED_CONTAM: hypothetical protein FKN15_010778 [Acipenser sinensis]